ncbi:Utp14 protein-domain-containing protein [Phlyctochytrium arcticum]|nr:Utp14 protein-domain-containing protein [Phlyctochytrium arcticum]
MVGAGAPQRTNGRGGRGRGGGGGARGGGRGGRGGRGSRGGGMSRGSSSRGGGGGRGRGGITPMQARGESFQRAAAKVWTQPKAQKSKLDVYEASDEEEDERRILARRGGGGGAVGRTMDLVENYEYHVDEIAEEDDEEIDEDEAFCDSDEEKYGSFFAEKGPNTSNSANLDEDDESEGGDEDEDDDDDDDDPEAYMDLSEMLGSSSSSVSKTTVNTKLQPVRKTAVDKAFETLLPPTGRDSLDSDFDEDLLDLMDDEDQEDGDESDEGSSEDEDLDDDEDLVDANGDPIDSDDAAAERLTQFVQEVNKAPERIDRASAMKRKREAFASVRTEAVQEGAYSLGPTRDTESGEPSSKRLGLGSMVAGLPDDPEFSSFKKSVLKLNRAEEKTGGAFAEELPRREQERYDRKVAYDATRKEVSKWEPMVKKNRESAHLTVPTLEKPIPTVSASGLVAKFTPFTDFESEVQHLLEESALQERQQLEMEELELNKISKEEVAERRAELAKIRALMFFKEQKQKKIAKIKSKAYRRIRKKEREGGIDKETLGELDPEFAATERDRVEMERARERMTLKHKNTGKWAKQMKGRHDDGDTQRAIASQLEEHEKLKRKIRGDDSDEESDDEYLDDVAALGDDVAGLKGRAVSSLDKLAGDVQQPDDESGSVKGLFAMKFMQRGVEKQKRELLENVEGAQKRLRDDYVESDSGDDNATKEKAGGKAVAGNAGRLSFAPKKTTRASASNMQDIRFDESDEDGDGYAIQQKRLEERTSALKGQTPIFEVEPFEYAEVSNKVFSGTVNGTGMQFKKEPPRSSAPEPKEVTGSVTPDISNVDCEEVMVTAPKTPLPRGKPAKKSISVLEESDVNPWLISEDNGPLQKSTANKSLSGNVGKTERAVEKLQQERKRTRNSAAVDAAAGVTLDMSGVRALETVTVETGTSATATAKSNAASSNTTTNKSKSKSQLKSANPTFLNTEAPSDSDSDIESSVRPSHTIHSLTSQDLLQLAFANDDVGADFEAEKKALIEEEAPKEKDVTLPGWGSWGGIGLKPKKKVIVKPKPGDGIEASKRKDAKLAHVIINEKRLKKSAKYMVTKIPHGFGNKEQYERQIRNPLGKEWNASTAFADLNKPRVQTKLGVVIAPLKYTVAKKDHKDGKRAPKKARL